MHSALSKLLYLWDLEEQRGGVKGLKSSYEGKRASIMGRDEPSRNHILKKWSRLIQIECILYLNLPFFDFSPHSAKGYAIYKSKKVKSN